MPARVSGWRTAWPPTRGSFATHAWSRALRRPDRRVANGPRPPPVELNSTFTALFAQPTSAAAIVSASHFECAHKGVPHAADAVTVAYNWPNWVNIKMFSMFLAAIILQTRNLDMIPYCVLHSSSTWAQTRAIDAPPRKSARHAVRAAKPACFDRLRKASCGAPSIQDGTPHRHHILAGYAARPHAPHNSHENRRMCRSPPDEATSAVSNPTCSIARNVTRQGPPSPSDPGRGEARRHCTDGCIEIRQVRVPGVRVPRATC